MLEELLEKINKLNYSDRKNLLNDQNIVEKLFIVDKISNPWDFQKVVELFEVNDLLKVFNKNIIEKIKKYYPNGEFIYIETLKLKDRDVLEKYLKINSDLIELLLLKVDLYINADFSYDMVLYFINYIEKNKIDYSKTCLYTIMLYSLKDKKLQERFFL